MVVIKRNTKCDPFVHFSLAWFQYPMMLWWRWRRWWWWWWPVTKRGHWVHESTSKLAANGVKCVAILEWLKWVWPKTSRLTDWATSHSQSTSAPRRPGTPWFQATLVSWSCYIVTCFLGTVPLKETCFTSISISISISDSSCNIAAWTWFDAWVAVQHWTFARLTEKETFLIHPADSLINTFTLLPFHRIVGCSAPSAVVFWFCVLNLHPQSASEAKWGLSYFHWAMGDSVVPLTTPEPVVCVRGIPTSPIGLAELYYFCQPNIKY